MTKEQKEAIEEQISIKRDIVFDLLDEICYLENEIRNLQSLIDDDSKVESPVIIQSDYK